MSDKNLMKIKNINSQPNLSLSNTSRNKVSFLDKIKNNSCLSNKIFILKCIHRNTDKFRNLTACTKSQIFSSALPLYKTDKYPNQIKSNNNNIYNSCSNIKSTNPSSTVKYLKIPKLNLSNKKYINNCTTFNISIMKNKNIQEYKCKTQRNYLRSKNIKNENDINNVYYKIFPKHIKEKPVEKINVINNIYNYYCCNENEKFEQIIKRENDKRLKLNKPLIKLPLKNEDTKEKITTLKKKAKFIGNIINYCYPKAFVYKIKKKTYQLKKERKQFLQNYILPTKEMDLIKQRENEKTTISLLNNSFNIINKKNFKNK